MQLSLNREDASNPPTYPIFTQTKRFTMACPYQDNPNIQQLPCHFIPHPEKPNLYFCNACCIEKRDIRELDDEFPIDILATFLGILLIVFGVNIMSPPNQSAPQKPESAYQTQSY
jgi:hypothetical protein